MLRMAEEDWLGYLLVSLFQESSVCFYDDCKSFYRLVEEHYNIKDFFNSWMQHIELDLKEKHAEGLAILFDSDESLSRNEVIRSLYNAWTTFEFLISSLDEILEQNLTTEDIILRRPICNVSIETKENSLLWEYSLNGNVHIKSKNAFKLYSNIKEVGLCLPPKLNIAGILPLPDVDSSYLLNSLLTLLFQCLSYSTTHTEIMLYGQLMQQVVERLKGKLKGGITYVPPQSPFTIALANFFAELARFPLEFGFIYYHAYSLECTLLSKGYD